MRYPSVVGALGLCALVLSFAAQAQQAAPAAFEKARPAPVCASCHEKQTSSLTHTAHGALNDANGTMCQTCHGDATAHLADPMKAKPPNPFSRTKPAPAADQSQVCLNCHGGSRHLAFWESGKHAKQDVSCASCHSMHVVQRDPTVSPYTTSFRPNEADLCGTCHQPIRMAIMKPSHHPIIENKMKCSDCHNPHGALSPVMLRHETVNAQCTSCHAEKRGPFVFPHPPVDENCLTCHTPHGSTHYKLTTEHVPNLCQDCHDWSRHPGSFYQGQGGWTCLPGDTSSACNGKPGQPNTSVNTRLIARSCLNCHNAVHGSNAPGNRGKFLTR